MIRIAGLGTAVPTYIVEQTEIQEHAARHFAGMPRLERRLKIFENARILRRHLAQPLAWYAEHHSLADKNTLHNEIALELAVTAAKKALAESDTAPEDIAAVLFVSSTGLAAPSLDATLIERLGLSQHTARIPVWGWVCVGGVAGLARAMDLARAWPDKAVLMVTVELNSLTFQPDDYSLTNLVSTALFADGAAAVVLKASGTGPTLVDSMSTVFEDSAYVMGWDVIDTGLKVRLDRTVPEVTTRELPSLFERACERWGVARDAIKHYVLHPGGVKVLEAYQQALGLAENKLSDAYGVLADFGNMSGVTILFVLERFIRRQPATGELGLIVGLGAGFSAEQVLFRW